MDPEQQLSESRDTASAQSRQLQGVLGFVSVLGIALLAISLVVEQVGQTASAAEQNLRLLGIGLFSLLLWMVRSQRAKLARVMLPAAGWVLANVTLIALGGLSPLFAAYLHGLVVMLAGGTLGHRGLASFAALSGLSLLGFALVGQAGWISVADTPYTGWFSAATLFILVVVFGYYFRRTMADTLATADDRAEALETLRHTSLVVSSSLERDVTIERILEQLERVVPYDSAAVMILDGDQLEIVGGRGWDDPSMVVAIRFTVPGDNPNTTVIETGRPNIVRDAPSEYGAFRQPPHDHIRSWLGVPLLMGDQLTGMLSLDSIEFDHFSREDADLVAAFASHVSVALANAEHFHAGNRRRKMAAQLQDIMQISNSSFELDEVLRRVIPLTAEATDSDFGMVVLLEETWETALIARRDGETAGEWHDELQAALSDSFSLSLFESAADQPLPMAAGAPDDVQALPLPLQQAGVQRLLLVPMLSAEKQLGALGLVRTNSDSDFNHDQIDVALTVSASVAASIRNARLYLQTQAMATTDSLTGLPNRRAFFESAELELARSLRYERPLAILMLDIDHFKQLNDRHGHLAGDEVLAELALRLRQSVRSIDLVARYGGEEFVALLPECDLPSAEAVAERVRAAIGSRRYSTRAGDLPLSISIGVCSNFAEALELPALLDAADRALYAAKQAGRDQVWSIRGDAATAVSSD